MNHRLAALLAALGIAGAPVQQTEPPPWARRPRYRGHSSKMGTRVRLEAVDNMNRKRCESRLQADAIRMDLRGQGRRHVVRYSEQISGRMVWFVAWSR